MPLFYGYYLFRQFEKSFKALKSFSVFALQLPSRVVD